MPSYDASQGGWVYWENGGCPVYPTIWGNNDPNFVGYNVPVVGPTSGGVVVVNQNVWSPICINSSGALVNVNDATCVDQETQTEYANSGSQAQFINTTPTNPSGGVTAFPATGTYAYHGVVDNYTSLVQTYNQTLPIDSHFVGWAMTEDYFTEPGYAVSTSSYEVSIQTDQNDPGTSGGSHTCPSTLSQNGSGAGWNYGIVANDVDIDGTLWHICDGQNNHQSSGACKTTYNYCGQLVFHEGCDENAWPNTPTTSGTINTKDFVTYLETHDVPRSVGLGGGATWGSVDDPCSDPSQPATGSPGAYASYPYITPGASVANLALGWEVVSTSGVPETLNLNGFSITATK